MAAWRHGFATVNGVRLHYVEAGDGPLVILLHGFPEFWYSWRRQIAVLAAAGLHAVAPDLRGYNLSEKPPGIENYRVALLMDDVAGLIDHFGAERAHIAGHDWGGVIAWRLAMHRPGRVDRLAILNAPHPAAFYRALRTNSEQWLRSLYILQFQVPYLPERFLAAGKFRAITQILRHEPLTPGAFTRADIARYQEALAQPGALTAALNYYRAAVRLPSESLGPVSIISAQTLVLWGMQDRYLDASLSHGLQRWVPRLSVRRFRTASHWLQNDAVEAVNEALVEFFLRGW